MATDAERLDEADACHDGHPARGAELLRAIDAAQLPSARWPGYAFLLNHVLGEKLNRWDEALQRQRQLLSLAQPAPAAALWRQAATAARLAAAGAEADALAHAFAQASGASLEHGGDVLRLSAAMFRAPGLAPAEAGEHVLAALAPLGGAAWLAANPLDASVAACVNNMASGLLDRPVTDLRHPTARTALAQAAEQAQRFWLRAGTWLQHERALYQRAMVCNALGQPHEARAHARAALALLDAHDTGHAEDVDRALIELERQHACERLGLSEADTARHNANTLAGRFDDAALTRWFEQRAQALQSMPQR